MQRGNDDNPADPAWVRLCAAGELDPGQRLAARRAILANALALDATLYRSAEDDPEAEEEELGDARILLTGPFRAPAGWGPVEHAEYFAGNDPELFFSAFIECVAASSSPGFFTADVGDYVAAVAGDGQVQMYFVHDWQEDEQGRLCVLLRDDQPLF